ncbi:hypothetical protein DPMN_042545 [Dreissena polymorpha]|nr:hypothetical protein DPMN_042545 [Dreissena polymorpha]
MSVYLSEFIDVMDLADATRDIRRQAYLVDILRLMLTRFLHKLSGSSHRQLFKILDQLVHTVLKTEVGVRRLQRLLHETHKHLVEDTSRIDTRIGCRSLWNRHTQNVSNLLTQMGGFVYTEREEDGKPQLMDLPKECLFEIMYKLTDHRDLINLGLACWDLYHVTREESIWQKLLGFHFSPKQVATFTECIEDSDGDTLLQLYRHCYRKFGFRKLYTADQLVICSACKTLHWLKLGHYCWSDDKDRVNAVMEPISP